MAGVILSYHRVADPTLDTFSLAVSPAHFGEHLRHIADTCRPMALAELGDALESGGLPDRAVAVTFDDGYRDNLAEALPALERHGVPATVFVATGYTDGEREFWWDDLERLLVAPRELPARLDLTIGGRARGWPTASPDERLRAMLELHGLLRTARRWERSSAIISLAGWAGQGPEGRPSHLAMTSDHLRELAASPLMSIGAHSVSHPVMSALSADWQRVEIAGSRGRLERIAGRPVDMWAHPYGGDGDFDDVTVGLLRDLGFRTACSSVPGAVGAGDDPLRLKRCTVRDWDGGAFASRLEDFFD